MSCPSYNQASFNKQLGCFDLSTNVLLRDRRRRNDTERIPATDGLTSDDLRKKQEMDSMIAQAMNALSFEERQEQQEILHGVDTVVEDPTFLNRALEDLNCHLLSIKSGTVYEIAESMDPEYVNGRAFRVMFLRGNEYDAKAAADQMLRFFELKQRLFGPAKLVKDITIEDLDEDDMACLNVGARQLAGKDSSGRQIYILFGGLFGNTASKTTLNDLRVQYFIVMRSLMQSDDTQIRGTISIWYAIGADLKSKPNGTGYIEHFLAGRALPQKKCAIHLCTDDMQQALLCNALIKVMKGSMRARLRLHLGSRIECQYQLSTYGILPSTLPLDAYGNVSLDLHQQWIRSCLLEAQFGGTLPRKTFELTPMHDDVIFDGNKTKNHPGNQRFVEIIHDQAHVYGHGTEQTKRRVVMEIIESIRLSGGRFLKPSSEALWQELPLNELRKKIMQSFRNHRRRLDVSKQSLTNMNGTFIIGEPLPSDVIFGRAKRNQGARLLHSLIKDNLELYESLDRGVKMKLVEEIIQTIKTQGGRFLQSTTDQPPFRWIEVADDNAVKRISKYFRNYRRATNTGL